MPDPTNPDKLLWVDVETNGLDSVGGFLLEVGLRLTDLGGQTIAGITQTITYRALDNIRALSNPFVIDMHDKNGLWKDCVESGNSLPVAEHALMRFLEDAEAEGMALAGSSVQFDRDWLLSKMPNLSKMFHYRNIDNSTVKELCRRHNAKVFEAFEEMETDHRVWNCLDATIHEANYYREHFLRTDYGN